MCKYPENPELFRDQVELKVCLSSPSVNLSFKANFLACSS